MRAVVALGNPGPRYATSRHNAGFLLADVLREAWRFPRFGHGERALVSEGQVAAPAVRLVKPLTFMNRSGAALLPLLRDSAFQPSRDLLVLVDDLALPLGTFRVRARGSSGGHNGLESIEAALGTRDYARLRIGIGPMPTHVDDPAEWVLEPFTRQELAALADLLPTLADAVECWIAEGVETTMNRFNTRGTRE